VKSFLHYRITGMNLDENIGIQQDIFALIPARIGSKGVIKKNIEKIDNKTLVAISIEQAKLSIPNDKIYVSTDSPEIMKIAKDLNVNIMIRSENASTDSATADEVVIDFLNFMGFSGNGNIKSEIIVYLQPTSPFRSESLISNCIKTYLAKMVPVVTVRQVKDHPLKILTINDQMRIQTYSDLASPTSNRQNFEELHIASGSVYVFSVNDFENNYKKIPIVDSIPVIVTDAEKIDIDDTFDLYIAKLIGECNEF